MKNNKLYQWNQRRKTPHTITALADLLGTTRATLYRWFGGQIPTVQYNAVIKKVTGNRVSIKDWY